jgi:hypothetical protein
MRACYGEANSIGLSVEYTCKPWLKREPAMVALDALKLNEFAKKV